MRRFFLICVALLAGGTAAFGYTNILENETSQTITNGWDAAGDMTVGGSTSNNTLTIVAGGSLTNINAFVGAQAGASDNTATVSGAGAEWINTGTLQVGAAGNSNNTVSVSGGGTISATGLTVYTNNAFNLNADGTLEIGGFFNAGQDGFNWNDGGHLSVGGQLWGLPVTNLNNAATTIFDGENKKLTLNGGDALWNNGTNNLIVGLEGSGNQLIVTNGGSVKNADAYVGYGDTANSNSVVVTGTNSLWSNTGTLTVGSTNNAGNSVMVADGGKISAAGLTVNSNNTFNLNTDGNLDISGNFNAGQGGFNWNNGGHLSVGGDLAGIDGLYGTNQLLTIDGGTWTTNTDLTIGLNSSGNYLTIQGGGVVSNVNAYIGFAATANSNNVEVADSSWINTGDLYVGNAGSHNTLDIMNDAVVSNANAFVGQNVGADSNTVTVTGPNSLWVSTGTLDVGAVGNSGNAVTVTNSGRISVDGLTVAAGNDFNLDRDGELAVSGIFNAGQAGFNWGDGGHLIVQSNLTGLLSMDDADQKLTIDGGYMTNSAGEFYIGWNFSNNRVAVTNGALVEMNSIYLGYNQGSDSNVLLVSGTNSMVNTDDALMVGRDGGQNRVEIGSMGRVTNGVSHVGYGRLSTNNSVAVSGEGATWINGTLNVGWYTNSISPQGDTNWFVNSGNSVTVTNGGLVQADSLVIQNGNDFYLSDGGTLRMTGDFTNSAKEVENLDWQKGGNLSVGGVLSGITNLNNGRILTLDGSGALWVSAADTNMMVSDAAILNVTNGAVVKAGNLELKNSKSALNVASNAWVSVGSYTNALPTGATNGGMVVASLSGAEVLVDDFAEITIASDLFVGLSPNETGTVSVANGGTITAGDLVVADANSAFNLENKGTLAITGDFDATSGQGFNWFDGGHLSVASNLTGIVDLEGEDRTLTINGGTWTNGSGDRIIGDTGSGNLLEVLAGGYVSNTNGYVGFTSNAWNNGVVVSGSNSVWENFGTLQVGAADTNGASLNGGNYVTVSSNGTVIADTLLIHTNNQFNLDTDGTLRMTGDFNISDYINDSFTNLVVDKGGNLSIGGTLEGLPVTNLVVDGLTNTYAYHNGGYTLLLDGADANMPLGGNTNLIVGFTDSGNGLVISNTGKVSNANGYIGWGSGAGNNSVLVSGAGSAWTNRENLYVGGYAGSNSWYNAGANNSMTVESNGWVFVGDAATNLATNPGGIAVAGANGAEMVVGNGDVSIDALYVGAGSSFTGTVDVLKDGAVTLKDLVIADGLGEFNLEGTLNVVSNSFDANQNGFNWLDYGRLVMQESDLYGVSSITGAHQGVTINGGSWSNSGGLAINGNNNELWITSSSNNNSLVTSTSGYIGTTTNDFNNSVTLSGINSVWNNTGNLTVGYEGTGNSLMIEEGATNNNVHGYIGYMASASNNWVSVTGSNSVWNNSGDLFVGYEGFNSTLTIEDYGHVSVGTNLYVQNDGTLNLASSGSVYVANIMTVSNATVAGSGKVVFSGGASRLSIYGTNSQIFADVLFDGGAGEDTVAITENELVVAGSLTNRFVGFENLNMTNSLLDGNGTLDAFTNITMSGGWISPAGDLVVEGNFEVADNAILQVTAGEGSLRVTDAGGLNLTNMSAEVTILDSADPVGFDEVILTADGGLTGAFASTNFIEHFLLYDFALTNDSATTVSVVSETALDGEVGSAVEYAGIQGVRAGFNGMQNAAFVRTKQMRRNSVATDQAISHEAYLMSDDEAPFGPLGPGDKNTIFGMHFWAEQFSGQGDYDAAGLSDAYTLNNNGTTFGFDRLFGDSLVAGINYTYVRSAASMTGGDRVDTETYWLGLYGEWFGKNDYYLEGLIGLGWSDYDTIRTDGGYRGIGSYEGLDFGGHVEAGKYLHYDNWAMAPYAGLNYLFVKSDAYVEADPAGGPSVSVDGQNVASLESSLGVKLRNRFDTKAGRFQTVGYAEWAYDFINDEISSSLSAGEVSIETARVAPGETLINAGIGLSWICTDYLEVGVGYDGRFNDNYEEHMGSAMLDVRF